jgi:hypothetical protein
MLAESTSIFTASLLLETGWVDLKTAFLAFAGLQIACGGLWILLVVPRERRDDEAEARERDAQSSRPQPAAVAD